MLSIIKLAVIVLSSIVLSVIVLSHYPQRCCAYNHYTVCHYVRVIMLSVDKLSVAVLRVIVALC